MNLSPSSADAAATVTHSSVIRRTSQAKALFWPLCALLLSVYVVLALPGQRVALGASQLKGLVGSYTGHGNWRITANYIGSCVVDSEISNTTVSGEIGASVAGKIGPVITGTYDLARLFTPLAMSESGGVTTSLHNSAAVGTYGGTNMVHLSMSGAKIHYVLTWLPESGDLNYDPSPENVAIFYRCAANATTYASALGSGDSGKGSATVSGGGGSIAAAFSNATGPNGGDPETGAGGTNYNPLIGARFVEAKLNSKGGGTSYDVPISMDLTGSGVSLYANSIHQGSADGTITVDFCIAGFDMGRFGGATSPLGGGQQDGSSDPSYTRWLPLAFSPQMNSQPFRYQAGALPAPWGNLTCQYSPALRQEPSTPNPDVDGTALEIQPSYNPSPAPAFIAAQPANPPKYSIVDANGERLVFQANYAPNGNIHSTLTNQGNGYYTLSNAGPPGAMKEKGNYTYSFFQNSAQNAPLTTQLLTIRDDLGNQQSLSWGTHGLTVSDSSSGRSLVFNTNANGYFSSVDAPEIGVGIHTHTTLTWDANWHCTAVNVYDGLTNNLLHTDTFGYGGPNGDSITSTQKGVSTTNFNYVADPQFPDPFGLLAPRLSSVTYGSGSDSSSSDDGGSVAGTYSQTFGPVTMGYNNWGISAHTNTSTDARGTMTKTVFKLSNDVYGDLVGTTSTSPSFTGSTAANTVRTTYFPTMDQPQTTKVFDQLFYAGLSTQPWIANLDLLGNLTSVSDPLGNAWNFGYTADGKYLASISDPMGIGPAFSYGDRNNPASRLTTISDPVGGTSLIDYNPFGQPTLFTNSTSAGQALSAFVYDATTGDLNSVTGPLGDVLRVSGYDALGDPLGAILYPDTGNPATSTQPLAATITYDAAQMPVTITGPNGLSLNTTFLNGVMGQFTVQSQGQTLSQMTLSHDMRGRVYAATDLVGSLAGYRFDKNSNVTRILDGNGSGTQMVYGSNNELTRLLWPDGNSASLLYDAAGRVRQSTDERGIVCNYVYDNAHRLTDMQFPAAAVNNVHYVYDNASRLLSVSDATGSRTFLYNPNTGQLLQAKTIYSSLPAGSNTFVCNYFYNGDGSVSSVTSPVGTTLFQYNVAGEVTQITAANHVVTSYNYDHIGRLTGQSTQVPNGQILAGSYTWGVSGLAADPSTAPLYMRQLGQSVGTKTWTDTLTHSLLGQLVRQDETTNQAGVNGYAAFAYDLRGRLSSENTHWQANAQTAYNVSSGYQFDAANNLQAGAAGWTVNSSNQVTAAPPLTGSPGLAGATGLSYDAAGNTQTCSGTTLGYNVWGDLNSLSLPGNIAVSYVYDSSGRRVSKTVGTSVTYYLYAGSALIAELDGSGAVTRQYTWGATGLVSDTSGVGAGAQTRLYVFDGLGNTRALVDGTSGAILWQGGWSAWGQPNGSVGTGSAYGWHGQTGAYLDGESGLLQMGARYYAPSLGRFLTRDPSGFSAGANLYAFCLGDPIDFCDPNGCEPINWEQLLRGCLPRFQVRTWGPLSIAHRILSVPSSATIRCSRS